MGLIWLAHGKDKTWLALYRIRALVAMSQLSLPEKGREPSQLCLLALSTEQGGLCRRLRPHPAAERGGPRDVPGGAQGAARAGEAALGRQLQVCAGAGCTRGAGT